MREPSDDKRGRIGKGFVSRRQSDIGGRRSAVRDIPANRMNVSQMKRYWKAISSIRSLDAQIQ